jgi:putative peptidoglycan lipid II flippase
MPALTERMKIDGTGVRARRFFSEVVTALGLSLLIVSVILWICMPFLAPILAPGFTDVQLHGLVLTSRIMLFSPIILGLSNTIATITQMEQRFLVYSMAPMLYNIGIIIGSTLLYKHLGLTGLALGVVIGAFLHGLVQVPVLMHAKFVPRFVSRINWKEMFEIVKISLPRTFGLSISGLTAVILGAFVTRTGEGAVSIFNLTYNLQSVPIGIIGISFSVASFPSLVQLFHDDKKDQYVAYIVKAVRHIVLWSVPVTVLFIVLRAHIIRILLGTGSFSWNDTRLASASLLLFALSVIAQSLVHLFVRAFYAEGDTKHPVLFNIIGEIVTIVLAFLLPFLAIHVPSFQNWFETVLRVKGILHTGMLLFPLAFTIGNIVNIILLLWFFWKRWVPPSGGIWQTVGITSLGSVFAGVGAYIVLQVLAGPINQGTFWGIVLQGGIAGIVGVMLWGGFVWMCRKYVI